MDYTIRINNAADRAALSVPPTVFFVAANSCSVDECVYLAYEKLRSGMIQRLYVRPKARGFGLGVALMNAAIEHARAAGCNRVVLDTQPEALPEAYLLYEKLGCRECSPFMAAPYPNVQFMELPLGR